jgi:DUF4097 and DUF4098 domain-containing protein YvlB
MLEASMRKLLVTILFTFAAASASAAELHETIDRTFDVRPGAHLALDNVNGRVTVTSWNQPRIRVHADKSASGWDSAEVKQALREVRVEIDARPDGVTVKTVEPDKNFGFFDFLFGHHVNRNVTYEITVPRNADLNVDTVNGSVHVNDVTGIIKLETTNGKIEVARCGGSVDASTTNGGIHAELLSVTRGKSMTFETTNGHITIVVPPNLATEVDASTTNGRINTDLPVSARTFDHNTLRGTINGGGGMLRLRTTNGGIDIKTTG